MSRAKLQGRQQRFGVAGAQLGETRQLFAPGQPLHGGGGGDAKFNRRFRKLAAKTEPQRSGRRRSFFGFGGRHLV